MQHMSCVQAGYETTASTITRVCFELLKYPDIVDKMYDEIVSVCGKEGEVTESHASSSE